MFMETRRRQRRLISFEVRAPWLRSKKPRTLVVARGQDNIAITPESTDVGLARYLSRSDGTSALLDRLRRNLARANEPDLKKRLTDAIQYVEAMRKPRKPRSRHGAPEYNDRRRPPRGDAGRRIR